MLYYVYKQPVTTRLLSLSILQVQVQVETIVELLQKTEMSFVFCLVPHHLAGLCELFKKSPGRYSNQKLIRDQVEQYANKYIILKSVTIVTPSDHSHP